MKHLEAQDRLMAGDGIFRRSEPHLIHVSTKFKYFPNDNWKNFFIDLRTGLMGPYLDIKGINWNQLKERRAIRNAASDWETIPHLCHTLCEIMEKTEWVESSLCYGAEDGVVETLLPSEILARIKTYVPQPEISP